VLAVQVLPDGMTAEVVVGDRQLSLAIGKEGQNARLAAKLTGLRIDIKSQSAAGTGDGAEEPALAISAEPDVKRETPIWAEVAAREEAERAAAEQAAAAAAAASIAPAAPAAPAEPVAPIAPAARGPGGLRFADEVLPPTQAPAAAGPAGPARGGAAGGARGRRGGPGGREEDGRRGGRGMGGGRNARGGGRRTIDEEIEEEWADLEAEDFDFFGLKDEDE
jgi:N utilization substance protein A